MAQDLGHVNDLVKAIREAMQPYVSPEIASLILGTVVVLFLVKHFGVAAQIGRCFRWLTSRTKKLRVERRSRFADHVESQMRRLGEKEEWWDDRYVELEADLETADRSRRRFLRRTPLTSRQRVPSLSDALENSKERIVLLEGDPGAGKSTVMRHVAQRMAKRAMGDSRGNSVIPLYVNLKTFRPASSPTSGDVRRFVLESVNAFQDRDVDRFLDDEFDHGMQNGTWLILFDSFDEIPAILSATESNDVVTGYADAVYTFLHSMKRCRGVVASREFRGPGRSAWPTFRVAPLSQKRKKILVKRSKVNSSVESALLAELGHAEPGVQQMSSNPLFLSLLCEHMRGGNEFPTSVHTVIETYISHRLSRDAAQMRDRFDVDSARVRSLAEEFAFLIADRQYLGLSVGKAEAVSLLAVALDSSADVVERTLQALIYTKIARSGDDEGTVTFSHRRMQEYFATCVVIREPSRVSAHTMLTDGRWRETAVTILQTRNSAQTKSLMAEALRLLPAEAPIRGDQGLRWRPGLLYLLGILVEGWSSALSAANPDIADRVGMILCSGWTGGRLFDRKRILEVCTVADSASARHLLTAGFKSESSWLRQESFAQMRRVPHLSENLHVEIRSMLVDLSVGGRLRRERNSIRTQLRRMPGSERVERTFQTMLVGPFVHLLVVLGTALVYLLHLKSGLALAVTYSVLMTYYYFFVRFLTCHRSVFLGRFKEFVPSLGMLEVWVLAGLPMIGGLGALAFMVSERHRDGNVDLSGGLSSVMTVAVFVVPHLVFLFAMGADWWDRSRLAGVLLAGYGNSSWRLKLLVSAVVAAYFLISIWSDAKKWLVVPIGYVAVFVVLLTIVTAFLDIGVARFRQRGQLREFRYLISGGALPVEALRARLGDVRIPGVASAMFAEMNTKDVAWSWDVVAFLHEVARKLECCERDDDDPLDDINVVSWSRNPEVLDQLSIFLAAQRKKGRPSLR